MITQTLHSARPPAIVLEALRVYGPEWRESRIPDALRRAGVSAVECRISDATCTFGYTRLWYGPVQRTRVLRTAATALPDADGTTVQVVTSYGTRALRVVALVFGLIILASVMVLRESVWLLVPFLCVFGLNYLLVRNANRRLSRTDNPEADYLIRRVENAVAMAGAEHSNVSGQ